MALWLTRAPRPRTSTSTPIPRSRSKRSRGPRHWEPSPVDTGHPTNSSRSSKRGNYVERPICETPTQQGKTGLSRVVFNITMRGTYNRLCGIPHNRFDGRGLETERYGVTAPAPDPTNLPRCPSTWCSAVCGKSPEMTLRYAATLAATAEAEFLNTRRSAPTAPTSLSAPPKSLI